MHDLIKGLRSQKYFASLFMLSCPHIHIAKCITFTKRLFSCLMKTRSTSDDVYKEKGRFKMNYKKSVWREHNKTAWLTYYTRRRERPEIIIVHLPIMCETTISGAQCRTCMYDWSFCFRSTWTNIDRKGVASYAVWSVYENVVEKISD